VDHLAAMPSRVSGTPTTMMWVDRLGLEHAKQFLRTGRAIDADTALGIGLVSQVCDAEEIAATVEAEAQRFKHIAANQFALNKMPINQAYENMGLRTSQMLGTFFDGVTRNTEGAYRWVESFEEKGFRDVIPERDDPWEDYGSKLPTNAADR
jgi:enoyl-CoA hydratase